MKFYTLFYPIGLMNILDRFSFYGTRVMLILFFTSEFEFTADDAYEFYGAILALIYAVPIIGGRLVDKGFDRNLALFFGILFKLIGHFSLVFSYTTPALVGSFALIIFGHMFYKSTILTLYIDFINQLEKEKDKSFTFLFVCFQIGAVLGILICGFVAEKFGWRHGLLVAAIMLFFQFILFLKQYKFINQFISHQTHTKIKLSHIGIFLGVFGGIITALYYPVMLDFLFPIIFIWILFHIVRLLPDLTEVQKKNVYRLCFILFITVVYLTFYEQKAVSFNIYIKHFLNRDLWGFMIPATWFQMFSALFMVLFGSAAVWFWHFLKRKEREPKGYDKYIIGMILMFLAHLILFISFKSHLEHMLYVFMGVYIIIAAAESIIFPIVMASTSRYAPKTHQNFFVGLMAFSGSIAHYLASELAKLTSPTVALDAGELLNLSRFQDLILVITVALFICCLVMFLTRKYYLNKL